VSHSGLAEDGGDVQAGEDLAMAGLASFSMWKGET